MLENTKINPARFLAVHTLPGFAIVLTLTLPGSGCKVQGSRFTRKEDVRLPGKGNSNSHGARPVY